MDGRGPETAGGRPSAIGSPERVEVPSDDGQVALNGYFWRHPGPSGVLVIAHGLGEHAGCYDRAADWLRAAAGLEVLAADFRGHGLSPGRRGVVRRYDDLMADLVGAVNWASRRRPGLPRFVLAHSNGGQVALRAVVDGLALDGLVLSNPALALAIRVPAHLRLAGEVLRRLAPGVTLRATATHEMMTRDPENLASRRHDRLRHSRINAPLFFGMVEGGPWLADRAGAVRLPVLLLLGGQDRVIDPAASLTLFERLGSADKTLLTYPDALHEPLNDLGRDAVLADVAAWLRPRLAPPGG